MKGINFATTKDKVIFYLVISIIILIVLTVIILSIIDAKEKTFSNKDFENIYAEIEQKYGNGEKFNLVSNKTTKIKEFAGYSDSGKAEYNLMGERVTIVGYFDSNPNIYILTYKKENKEILCTGVVNSELKEDYLKQNK